VVVPSFFFDRKQFYYQQQDAERSLTKCRVTNRSASLREHCKWDTQEHEVAKEEEECSWAKLCLAKVSAVQLWSLLIL
jgi:hypothetical protein